jgi:hypothetical protein
MMVSGKRESTGETGSAFGLCGFRSGVFMGAVFLFVRRVVSGAWEEEASLGTQFGPRMERSPPMLVFSGMK